MENLESYTALHQNQTYVPCSTDSPSTHYEEAPSGKNSHYVLIWSSIIFSNITITLIQICEKYIKNIYSIL